MAKFHIEHERNICIGCGACAAMCPANWVMSEDGKSDPIKTELEELGCNGEAENACPVSCIHVKRI